MSPSPTIGPAISLPSSSNRRVSGKPWKETKKPTVRSHLQAGVKTKNWEDRMRKTQKALSIKKLQAELREEKQTELKRRREVTAERKKVADEKKEARGSKSSDGSTEGCKAASSSRQDKKDQPLKCPRQVFICVLYLPSSSKCVCLNTMIL